MGDEVVAGGGTMGVAGVLVLRPGGMPEGLDEGYDYEKACADLGVSEAPADGVVVWALYGPRADGSGLGRLSMVTPIPKGIDVTSALWSDDVLCAPPDIEDVLHVVEGWVHPGHLRLSPEYAALGWEGVSAMAIRHPPPDTSAGEHRPVRRDAPAGHQAASTVGCESCDWSQRIDGDALDDGADRLMAWHAAYPSAGVDHMGELPPHHRLRIPDYVVVAVIGRQLVVLDERTGLRHHRPGHAAVHVYETLGAGRRLAAPGHLPETNIVGALTDLYRWGLLVPTKTTDQPTRTTP